jgi:hypothetical protein
VEIEFGALVKDRNGKATGISTTKDDDSYGGYQVIKRRHTSSAKMPPKSAPRFVPLLLPPGCLRQIAH